VSPDGTTIAISWALTQSGPWQVVGLDAATGEASYVFDDFGFLWELQWSGDGQKAYAAENLGYVAGTGLKRGAHGTRIWEFELSGTPTATSIDLEFQIEALRADVHGRFYVIGYESDECCGIDIQGDPFLVALDGGAEVDRIALPGLVLGQRFEPRGSSDAQANIIRWPGVAISPGGDRLYIAHADDDAITVVDLEAMAVDAVVTPKEPRSALARFGSWLGGFFVSEAKAKGGAYYSKHAVVSPDGRYLYITGYQPEFCESDEFFPCIERKPIGLQVIALDTMEVVAHHDGIARIAFTPGLDRIVGTGETIDYRDPDAPHIERHGPFVIDAATHEIIAGPAAGQPDLVRGLVGFEFTISTDGRHGFFAVGGPGMEQALAEERSCATDCYALRTYDLETGTVVAERYYDGYISFINLVPQP
jgi:hypothetical protein